MTNHIEDVRAIAEKFHHLAKLNLERDKTLLGVGIILTKDEVVTISLNMRSPEEKPAYRYAFQQLAKAKAAEVVVVIFEAWVKVIPQDKMKTESIPDTLKGDPEAVDTIVVEARSADSSYLITQTFTKDKEGNIVFGEVNKGLETTLSNWTDEIFHTPTKH